MDLFFLIYILIYFSSNFGCWKHVVFLNRVNCRPALEADVSKRIYSEEFQADRVEDAVQVFADNLRHSDKEVRISTLRILCHYEPLRSAILAKDPSIDNAMETENLESCSDESVGSEVSLSTFLYFPVWLCALEPWIHSLIVLGSSATPLNWINPYFNIYQQKDYTINL